jgi:hypothetical protein
MRVSEHGLRRLARRLHVTLTDKGNLHPLEYADWDKLLTAIRNKIIEARKLSKGPRKEKQLQSWSEAGDHCEYMKDIWRNSVSHTRQPYKNSEALGACERVRDFMSFLVRSFKWRDGMNVPLRQ